MDANFKDLINPPPVTFDRTVAPTFIDASGIPLANYFNFGLQRAIAGGYDTFAFQGTGLFLGTYSDAYRFDRFGKPDTCTQFGAGGTGLVNRVYSTIPVKTYTAAQYLDKGSWLDGPIYAVAKTFIDLRTVQLPGTTGTTLAQSDYMTYATKKAIAGRYTTFAFQNGYMLFLGNYGPQYRYDKYGSSTNTNAFGDVMVNRVYSVYTIPSGIVTKSTTTDASGSTVSVARAIIIKRPPGYLGPVPFPKDIVIAILYSSCNYVNPVAFITTTMLDGMIRKVEDLGLIDKEIKSFKLSNSFAIRFQDFYYGVLNPGVWEYPFVLYTQSNPCVSIFPGRANYTIYAGYGQDTTLALPSLGRPTNSNDSTYLSYTLPAFVNTSKEYMGVLLYSECDYTNLVATNDIGVYDLDASVKSIEIAIGYKIILYGEDPSINITFTTSVSCLSTSLPFETAYFIEVIRL